MPTAPVDHDWEASHPITRHRSACSLAGYSSTATPSDDPVPRRSTRTTAYPYSPHSRSYSGRYDAVASSLRYGSASSTTGTFPPDRVPSGRNRLAASRTHPPSGSSSAAPPCRHSPGGPAASAMLGLVGAGVWAYGLPGSGWAEGSAADHNQPVVLGEVGEVTPVQGEQ